MIVKADGTRTPFDRKKAMHSCERSGASVSLAREIITIVEGKLQDGMTTSEMKKIIYEELDKREEGTAAIYNIRKAIAALDPSTHQFEKYISHLYQCYGYETEWSPVPKPMGLCVDHEIDVFLKKDEKISFVECKHHFSYHRFTGLNVAMRVWARLMDLQKGFAADKKPSYDFENVVIVTNTKFSEHAIKYANCDKKNMSLVGWNHPKDEGSLNYLIEKKKAYPLTILNLDAQTVFKLYELSVHDINDFEYVSSDILLKSGLTMERIKKLKELVGKILD